MHNFLLWHTEHRQALVGKTNSWLKCWKNKSSETLQLHAELWITLYRPGSRTLTRARCRTPRPWRRTACPPRRWSPRRSRSTSGLNRGAVKLFCRRCLLSSGCLFLGLGPIQPVLTDWPCHSKVSALQLDYSQYPGAWLKSGLLKQPPPPPGPAGGPYLSILMKITYSTYTYIFILIVNIDILCMKMFYRMRLFFLLFHQCECDHCLRYECNDCFTIICSFKTKK